MSLRGGRAAAAWIVGSSLAGALLAPVVHAGQFGISPMRLELSPKARTASLTIFNHDQVPLSFQVEVMRWRQDEAGQPINEPTSDLVYFPRLLTVAPGQEGVVRVGLRQPLVTTEHAFVVFVQEQPSAKGDSADGASLNVLLRVGATLFARPVRDIPRLEWMGGEVREGTLHFGVRNEGTRHQSFGKVVITARNTTGETVFQNELQPGRYLLAGHTRRFAMPLPLVGCAQIASLVVSVVTDQAQLRQPIEPDTAGCP